MLTEQLAEWAAVLSAYAISTFVVFYLHQIPHSHDPFNRDPVRVSTCLHVNLSCVVAPLSAMLDFSLNSIELQS